MTYRQLNDWDRKGALPPNHGRKANWRRYTPREAFQIAVCAEIRERFGVPIEKLKFVRDFMLQEGADHLAAARRLIHERELPVFLLTDLENVFIMDTDIEFSDLLYLGYFSNDDRESFVFLKVNPIVNRILALTTTPEPLLVSNDIRREIILTREKIVAEKHGLVVAADGDEQRAIHLIRDGQITGVEVIKKHGEVDRIVGKTFDQLASIEDLDKLAVSSSNQSMQVVTQDDRVVRVTQEISFTSQKRKPAKRDGKLAERGKLKP